MQMTPEEKEAQKATSNMRFMQMVFGAAGGAIMFGLVNSAAGPLMALATKAIAATGLFSTAAILPILGLAGIAIAGLSCVYLGATYMSKTVSMEQESQAQKIAQAKKGTKSAEVDIQPTRIEKTSFIPGVTTGDKASEAEASNDNNRLVAANSAMNQASPRIDASSVAGTQRVNEQHLQRA